MSRRLILAVLALAALLAFAPGAARAQDYPSKPVTLIVPLPPAPAWTRWRGFTPSALAGARQAGGDREQARRRA